MKRISLTRWLWTWITLGLICSGLGGLYAARHQWGAFGMIDTLCFVCGSQAGLMLGRILIAKRDNGEWETKE